METIIFMSLAIGAIIGLLAQSKPNGSKVFKRGVLQSDKIVIPQSMHELSLQDNFVIDVTLMNYEKRDMLNVTLKYCSKNRNLLLDIWKTILYGGVTSVMNMIGMEIITLIRMRRKLEDKWMAMLNKECIFIDSLRSVKDLYNSIICPRTTYLQPC